MYRNFQKEYVQKIETYKLFSRGKKTTQLFHLKSDQMRLTI